MGQWEKRVAKVNAERGRGEESVGIPSPPLSKGGGDGDGGDVGALPRGRGGMRGCQAPNSSRFETQHRFGEEKGRFLAIQHKQPRPPVPFAVGSTGGERSVINTLHC